MEEPPEIRGKNISGNACSAGTRWRRRISVATLLMCSLMFAAAQLNQIPGAAIMSEPIRAASLLTRTNAMTVSQFSHSTPAHRSVSCASCHERTDNSAMPRVPGHKACIDCHLPQFVAAPDLTLCANCHTGLDSRNPPLKPFPRLHSFNVKFDHAQHTSGAGRSAEGCATCHKPVSRGVALSIPAGLSAHTTCYACHTPQATSSGREINSCGVCHDLARYTPTPIGAKAFRLGFSHNSHLERKNLNCASCHTVRPNLPQGRQVSSTTPAQHFPPRRAQSCATCHDNRSAFGGNDFSDCKRCHTGTAFKF